MSEQLTNAEAIKKAKGVTGFHSTAFGFVVGYVDPVNRQLSDLYFVSESEAKFYHAWLIGALAAFFLGLKAAPQDRTGKSPHEWLLAAQQQNDVLPLTGENAEHA